jgi:lipopolysaccharide export system permease protein
MKLHLYFARRFLWAFLALFAVFGLFQALLDLIEELRTADEALTFSQVLTLTLLQLPDGLYQLMPLVMILSTIALFLALARSSELVVARAAGRSGLAVLAAPVVVAFTIGALSVGMLNPIVAATMKRYSELSDAYKDGNVSALSIGSEGLWLRQGGPQGQSVIQAVRANDEATVLYDVSFLVYAPDDGGPAQRIVAREARLEGPEWVLIEARVWPLSEGLNPQTGVRDHDELRLVATLTQESIRDRFGRPATIPLWDLPAFIADLEAAGFSARRHIVWFQMELAKPLFLTAMVLLGAGFTMRPTRLGRTGVAVLSAVLLGFGLYYVRNFAQILGENGQIAPLLAAWVPPVASVLLALGLILHIEDG